MIREIVSHLSIKFSKTLNFIQMNPRGKRDKINAQINKLPDVKI